MDFILKTRHIRSKEENSTTGKSHHVSSYGFSHIGAVTFFLKSLDNYKDRSNKIIIL